MIVISLLAGRKARAWWFLRRSRFSVDPRFALHLTNAGARGRGGCRGLTDDAHEALAAPVVLPAFRAHVIGPALRTPDEPGWEAKGPSRLSCPLRLALTNDYNRPEHAPGAGLKTHVP